MGKKKQKVLGIQLQDGEMEQIDESVARIPLASRNGMARAALHIGIQELLKMDPGDAARRIHDFNRMEAGKRFKEA